MLFQPIPGTGSRSPCSNPTTLPGCVGLIPANPPFEKAPAMPYEPRPIATEAVSLPEPLRALTERLAENTHDVWARQRLADGWTLGPRRDDAAKTHPGLIPYADLSDSERAYDRLTALETLKAILALGYTILPPEGTHR